MDYKKCNTYKEMKSLPENINTAFEEILVGLKKTREHHEKKLEEINQMGFWKRTRKKKEKEFHESSLTREVEVGAKILMIQQEGIDSNIEKLERMLKACVICQIKNCPFFNKSPIDLCPNVCKAIEEGFAYAQELRQRQIEEQIEDLFSPF